MNCALAAARLLLPGAVVSGRSAAVLGGAALAETDADVDVTVPPGSRGGTAPGVDRGGAVCTDFRLRGVGTRG